MADKWKAMGPPGCCCDGGPTPCPPPVITVLDRASGGNASGVTIEVYDRPYTADAAIMVASGASPLTLDSLPAGPPFFYVKIIDAENDHPIPVFNWIFVGRCGSLNLQYCKVTIDVDVESGADLTAIASRKNQTVYQPDTGWYSGVSGDGWGTWVTPTRNVQYYLAGVPSSGSTSSPITTPWIVSIFAEKEWTFGNCKQVEVTACGVSASVSLPLFNFEGLYYTAPLSIGVPGCGIYNCDVRGPGPEKTNTLYVTLTVTMTPYVFANYDTETGEPDPPPAEGSWRPARGILGDDWGAAIAMTYDEDLGYWTSGCRGGNGRMMLPSGYSYPVPVQSTRLTYGPNGTGLVYRSFQMAGCASGGVEATYTGYPIECNPTDQVVVLTVEGEGGGALTWQEAHEG